MTSCVHPRGPALPSVLKPHFRLLNARLPRPGHLPSSQHSGCPPICISSFVRHGKPEVMYDAPLLPPSPRGPLSLLPHALRLGPRNGGAPNSKRGTYTTTSSTTLMFPHLGSASSSFHRNYAASNCGLHTAGILMHAHSRVCPRRAAYASGMLSDRQRPVVRR